MNNPPGVVGQDLAGHEMADVLANTNPSSAKFLAFGREGSLINQAARRLVEREANTGLTSLSAPRAWRGGADLIVAEKELLRA